MALSSVVRTRVGSHVSVVNLGQFIDVVGHVRRDKTCRIVGFIGCRSAVVVPSVDLVAVFDTADRAGLDSAYTLAASAKTAHT